MLNRAKHIVKRDEPGSGTSVITSALSQPVQAVPAAPAPIAEIKTPVSSVVTPSQPPLADRGDTKEYKLLSPDQIKYFSHPSIHPTLLMFLDKEYKGLVENVYERNGIGFIKLTNADRNAVVADAIIKHYGWNNDYSKNAHKICGVIHRPPEDIGNRFGWKKVPFSVKAFSDDETLRDGKLSSGVQIRFPAVSSFSFVKEALMRFARGEKIELQDFPLQFSKDGAPKDEMNADGNWVPSDPKEQEDYKRVENTFHIQRSATDKAAGDTFRLIETVGDEFKASKLPQEICIDLLELRKVGDAKLDKQSLLSLRPYFQDDKDVYVEAKGYFPQITPKKTDVVFILDISASMGLFDREVLRDAGITEESVTIEEIRKILSTGLIGGDAASSMSPSDLEANIQANLPRYKKLVYDLQLDVLDWAGQNAEYFLESKGDIQSFFNKKPTNYTPSIFDTSADAKKALPIVLSPRILDILFKKIVPEYNGRFPNRLYFNQLAIAEKLKSYEGNNNVVASLAFFCGTFHWKFKRVSIDDANIKTLQNQIYTAVLDRGTYLIAVSKQIRDHIEDNIRSHPINETHVFLHTDGEPTDGDGMLGFKLISTCLEDQFKTLKENLKKGAPEYTLGIHPIGYKFNELPPENKKSAEDCLMLLSKASTIPTTPCYVENYTRLSHHMSLAGRVQPPSTAKLRCLTLAEGTDFFVPAQEGKSFSGAFKLPLTQCEPVPEQSALRIYRLKDRQSLQFDLHSLPTETKVTEVDPALTEMQVDLAKKGIDWTSEDSINKNKTILEGLLANTQRSGQKHASDFLTRAIQYHYVTALSPLEPIPDLTPLPKPKPAPVPTPTVGSSTPSMFSSVPKRSAQYRRTAVRRNAGGR